MGISGRAGIAERPSLDEEPMAWSVTVSVLSSEGRIVNEMSGALLF